MTNIGDLILNLPIKEMDGTLLIAEIQDRSSVFGAKYVKLVNEALALASYLHRKQTRANRGSLPRDLYITHPLRNAVRLFRYGVTDPEIIIAAILHDTVEDCAEEIVTNLMDRESLGAENSQAAFIYIEERFGFRIARIVKLVSNPMSMPGMSKDDKRKQYVEHVTFMINLRPDVFLVKFADWVDNAVGLKHNNTEANQGMVMHLTAKYLPLAEQFDFALTPSVENLVSEQGLKDMRAHIDSGRNSLTKMTKDFK